MEKTRKEENVEDILTVSKKTLEDMDKSIENINKGNVYGPVKIKE